MAVRLVVRRMTVLLAATLVVTGCAASDVPPSGGPGSGGPGGSPVGVPADAAALVEYDAAVADPAAAGHRELEIGHAAREDAGMPALLGPLGASVFTTLDAIEADAGQELVAAVATAVDAGEIPTFSALDRLMGQTAALGASRPARLTAPGAIDISLFAETGFTTSVLLGMFTQLVQRADESKSGTESKQTDSVQTADGFRQEVNLVMTVTIETGGGRVSGDLTLTATDRIFDARDNAFVGLYTSTSHGHFDVNACPDASGIGAGSYTFETKHELNDVSRAGGAVRSGASRSTKAPFSVENGDDAHLKAIKATLDLSADASGPGTSGGPGPTSAFDWAANQVLQVVIPRGGGTTGSGDSVAVTGTGGEGAGGTLALSSAMAQLFISEIGKQAELFWRSGKCFEVKTNVESKKVERGEHLDVEVSSVVQQFGGGTVAKPVVIQFAGKDQIDPASGTPLDVPATVSFTAGQEPRDTGTLTIEQISNRGIARKVLEFEVQPEDLEIRITGRLNQPGANLRLDTGEWVLSKTDRGFEQKIQGDVSGSVEVFGCSVGVSDELPLQVIAMVDEGDRDLVRLMVLPASFTLDKEQEITCQGVTTRVPVPTSDFTVPFLGTDGSVMVRVNQATTFRDSVTGAEVTVTVTRRETDP